MTTDTPTPPPAKKLRDAGKWRVLLPPDRPDSDGMIMYPADDAQLARLLKGDTIPRAEREMKKVFPGDVVGDFPAKSVPWMHEAGWITEANGPDDPYKKAPKAAKGASA